MVTLIEHHEHDYCAGPDVYRFGIRRFVEDFGSHVEQSSALGLDVLVAVDF